LVNWWCTNRIILEYFSHIINKTDRSQLKQLIKELNEVIINLEDVTILKFKGNIVYQNNYIHKHLHKHVNWIILDDCIDNWIESTSL